MRTGMFRGTFGVPFLRSGSVIALFFSTVKIRVLIFSHSSAQKAADIFTTVPSAFSVSAGQEPTAGQLHMRSN